MKLTLDDYTKAVQRARDMQARALQTQDPLLYGLTTTLNQTAETVRRLLLVNPPEDVPVTSLPWQAIWHSTEYDVWWPAAGAPVTLIRWEAQALANILGRAVTFDDPTMHVEPELG